MTPRGRHFAALGAGAALLMSAGCGSSDESKSNGTPLPQDAVAAIEKRLDEVQRRYDVGTTEGKRGACEDIENDSYKAIDSSVEGLPADVDADVRKALQESLSRLQELTREGCSKVKETPPKQDTTPQETTPPPIVTQETAPPEQTDTQQTVPDVKKPMKEKKKNGNGNGDDLPPGGTEAPGSNGGGPTVPQGGGE